MSNSAAFEPSYRELYMTTNPDKLRTKLMINQQAANDYLASIGRSIDTTEIKLFNNTDKVKYPNRYIVPNNAMNNFERMYMGTWDNYENTTAKSTSAMISEKDREIRKLRDDLARSAEEITELKKECSKLKADLAKWEKPTVVGICRFAMLEID